MPRVPRLHCVAGRAPVSQAGRLCWLSHRPNAAARQLSRLPRCHAIVAGLSNIPFQADARSARAAERWCSMDIGRGLGLGLVGELPWSPAERWRAVQALLPSASRPRRFVTRRHHAR